jgi:hypothetical protein
MVRKLAQTRPSAIPPEFFDSVVPVDCVAISGLILFRVPRECAATRKRGIINDYKVFRSDDYQSGPDTHEAYGHVYPITSGALMFQGQRHGPPIVASRNFSSACAVAISVLKRKETLIGTDRALLSHCHSDASASPSTVYRLYWLCAQEGF